MSIPSKPPCSAKARMASTCRARVVGSASTAAIPPAGMASTIDGTSSTSADLTLSMNWAVSSAEALGSTTISSAPTALNQNGDTSRIDGTRWSNSASEASSAQYGTHASSGMSGFGGGVSSFVATKIPAPTTAISTTTRPASIGAASATIRRRRFVDGCRVAPVSGRGVVGGRQGRHRRGNRRG